MEKATGNWNEPKVNERVGWLNNERLRKGNYNADLNTAMGSNYFAKKSWPTSLTASLGISSQRGSSVAKLVGQRTTSELLSQVENREKALIEMANPSTNPSQRQYDFMRSLRGSTLGQESLALTKNPLTASNLVESDSWSRRFSTMGDLKDLQAGIIPMGMAQKQAYAAIHSLVKSTDITDTLGKSWTKLASSPLGDKAIATQPQRAISTLAKSFAGAGALKHVGTSGIASLSRISSKDFTSHFSHQLATEAMRGRGYKGKTISSWLDAVGTNYLTNSDFYVSATPLIKKYDDSAEDKTESISTLISVAATKDLLGVATAVHKRLEVTEEELRELQSYLAESGYFALENPVARQIRDYFLNIKVAPQRIDDILFHGRVRNSKEQERSYTQSELETVAPWGVSGAGRFNEANHPLYYTCSDEGTLSEELKVTGQENETYDVLKFSIDREMKVLDLSKENHALVSYCLQKVPSLGKFSIPVEYQIPMFIGACLRQNRNIQAIKIRSVVSPGAINYIFFEPPFGEYVDSSLSEVHAGLQGTPVND
ncbi:RES family NAD+ phosphorylase [Levilactobacillus angrenensis]|uniref:RES family NAD+ phosphorylase n=1 Tax=Levilactobacillus angrenensis TaxID=2486020 RepID=A0ABW1UC82_9LACO|nr:RES family NAD+ phosphorylase [Levilactobacillus angrenensis]